MSLSEDAVGVLLAGGRSSRMGGGDKCLLPLAGQPMLERIIGRLRPQLPDLIINANGDASRFATFGLPIVEDRLGGYAGPLAGVHAALAWTKENRPGCRFVLSAATDTPFFPEDLVKRFDNAVAGSQSKLLIARSEVGTHPVFALWPMSLLANIEEGLNSGLRKVGEWMRQHEAEAVDFPHAEIGGRRIDPFFNINRPEDLAEAEALLQGRAA
jgi:molybdopterin-guanine dinucleotide biosynthesis protein A